MQKLYRIEAYDGRQWIPAPGDAEGWSLADAERAVAGGIIGLDGESFDADDVRIVAE